MAIVEGLTLDGLVLNDATFGLAALDLTPPKQRADWVGSADSEYAALFRDPLYENRTIVAKLSIAPQATMDLALGFVGSVRDKLAEASKTQDGLDLVWAPANGTKSVTFSVLAGEVSELPIDWENGWLVAAPSVTVSMTAKPFWRRSTETVLTAVASGTAPLTTVTVPSVGGDAPALGRLIVSNTGTGAIRWLEWGVEQRGYNAGSPASLVLDSDSLVTSGFAGTQTTHTGAYDPGATGNNVIRVTAPTSPTAVCGTGTQPHIGRFKVSARVFADVTTTRVRLVWRAGDGGYTANPWTSPPVAGPPGPGFLQVPACIDLGIIDIPAAVVGTQAWDGRVEVYDPTPAQSYTIDVDLLQLMPAAEGYGRSRTIIASSTTGSVVAWDAFTSTTAAGVLNARTPPAGAAWATSGATTDFAFVDAAGAGSNASEAVARSVAASALRYGVFGSAMTDQEVRSRVGVASTGLTANATLGVLARWTDANNHLRLVRLGTNGLVLRKVVAGTPTDLVISGNFLFSTTLVSEAVEMWLTAYASGVIVGRVYVNGVLYDELTATDSAAATGGALASGKAGIVDGGDGTNVIARWWDDITISTPAPEPIVIHPSRGYQVRGDDTLRESSAGGTWGRETSYRGSRFLIPAAGTDNNTSRVVVFAHTNDLETQPWDPVTVPHSVQVAYTERGLVVPR